MVIDGSYFMKATPPNDECKSSGGEECVTLAFPTIIHVYYIVTIAVVNTKQYYQGEKLKYMCTFFPSMHSILFMCFCTFQLTAVPSSTHPYTWSLPPSTHTSQLTAMRGGKVAFLTLLVLSREKRVEHTSYSARSSKVILDPRERTRDNRP